MVYWHRVIALLDLWMIVMKPNVAWLRSYGYAKAPMTRNLLLDLLRSAERLPPSSLRFSNFVK